MEKKKKKKLKLTFHVPKPIVGIWAPVFNFTVVAISPKDKRESCADCWMTAIRDVMLEADALHLYRSFKAEVQDVSMPRFVLQKNHVTPQMKLNDVTRVPATYYANFESLADSVWVGQTKAQLR